MKTAGEFLTEAQRFRDLEKDTSDVVVRAELGAVIAELETRAHAMEDGA